MNDKQNVSIETMSVEAVVEMQKNNPEAFIRLLKENELNAIAGGLMMTGA